MTRSLNYGIDFQGGIMIEIRTPSPGNIGQMRSDLSALGLGEINIQEFGEVTDFLIRVQKQEGGEGAQQVAVEKVKAALPSNIEYRRTEFVGPRSVRSCFVMVCWPCFSRSSAYWRISGSGLNGSLVWVRLSR